jgi:Arc/MetJ-type ribon-helix-helix transcriptional regulator
MKMITLFLPEKHLEMLDTLVASNLYPNRSEALRMATWKFLHESVAMLRAVPANASSTTPRAKHLASAKKEATPAMSPMIEDKPDTPGSADLDEILGEIDGNKTANATDADPFDEIVREQQHA